MNSTQEKTRKWTLDLGKVDYSGRGRKANRVTLDVTLRHKVNDTAPYLDVDLKNCRAYVELSIMGSIMNAAGSDATSCGQIVDEIGRLFPERLTVQRLVEIWRQWHLNGMKSGTREQNRFLADGRVKVTYPKSQYESDCELLEKANLLTVSGPEKANYKYGSAWLVEPLPAEVEAEVVSLCSALAGERQAEPSGPKDFAEEHGITSESVRVPENPNMPDSDDRGQRHFFVTLRHKENTRTKLTTYFSQGSAYTKPPTVMDVLGCLAQDATSADYSFEEWCSELGFDADSRKNEASYNAVRKQMRALKTFLGAELFKELLDGLN